MVIRAAAMRALTGPAAAGRLCIRSFGRLALLAACGASVLATCLVPVRAASLTALVPDDVGFCVEVQDLTRLGNDFFGGEFFRRLQNFPPAMPWLSANGDKPRQLVHVLANGMGMPADELAKRAMGRPMVLGVWPGELRNVAASRVLLIADMGEAGMAARTAQIMAESFEQPDLLVESRDVEHAGSKYALRTIRRGNTELTICLAAIGQVFVLASSEPIIQQTLDLHQSGEMAKNRLCDLQAYQQGLARLQPDAFIKLFINPRPWDEIIAKQLADNDDDPEALGKRILIESWRLSNYWVVSLETRPHLVIESYLHFDQQRLPGPLEDLGRSFSGATKFLDRVPADVAFAYAGQMDLAGLGRMFFSLIDEAQQQVLPDADDDEREDFERLGQVRDVARGLLMGLDLFNDVLTALGPDVGFYICPLKENKGPEPVPVDIAAADPPLEWILGARTQPRAPGDKRPEVSKALDNALRTAMILSASMQNARAGNAKAHVESRRENGLVLWTLKGFDALPEGLVATYTFADNYFFGGTSAAAVSRAATLRPAESLLASNRYQRLSNPHMVDASQIIYIDCLALRSLIRTSPDTLLELVSAIRPFDRQRAEEALDTLCQVLELGETVVLTAKVEKSGLAFSLDMAFEQPPPPAEK